MTPTDRDAYIRALRHRIDTAQGVELDVLGKTFYDTVRSPNGATYRENDMRLRDRILEQHRRMFFEFDPRADEFVRIFEDKTARSEEVEDNEDVETSISYRVMDNGGYVVNFKWESHDEDGNLEEEAEIIHAHSTLTSMIKDIVQFVTDSGDWRDDDSPPDTENKELQSILRSLGG